MGFAGERTEPKVGDSRGASECEDERDQALTGLWNIYDVKKNKTKKKTDRNYLVKCVVLCCVVSVVLCCVVLYCVRFVYVCVFRLV